MSLRAPYYPFSFKPLLLSIELTLFKVAMGASRASSLFFYRVFLGGYTGLDHT